MGNYRLRIGTRGSELALAQAQIVKDMLLSKMSVSDTHIELVPIKTTGDLVQDLPLRDIGGKGLFCRSIESVLLNGEIDMAVHSYKDLPVNQPEGLCIDSVLKRGDPRDSLIASQAHSIECLPKGTVLGTSSLRRKRQVLHSNPEINVVDLRGNVQTRLNKWRTGEIGCLILAMAGLVRLGYTNIPISPISISEALPAPAQGVICIERRIEDERMQQVLAALNDEDTMICALAERAFLERLGGSCDLPVGAFASLVSNGQLSLKGEFFEEDGPGHYSGSSIGDAADPQTLGYRLADDLLKMATG